MSGRWPRVPLGDLAHRITKGTTPTSVGGRFTDSGIRFVKVESISDGGALLPDKLAFIDHDSNRRLARSQLSTDDVLFSIAGAIGRTYLVRVSDLPANTNQALAIVRFNRSKIFPAFAYYAMRDWKFQGQAKGRALQVAQANVNLSQLSRARIPVPPLEVQKRIASVLAVYDDLIENNRRRIQLLGQVTGLLYKKWFVQLRFPGHEHVTISDGVPEGWEKRSLGDLMTLQRGFDLPVRSREKGPVPVYSSTGVNGFHDTAKVSGPGVVTGRSGSLGEVMYVAGDFWPLNTTLWVKEFKRVSPLFARHLLSGMKLAQYNGGTAVPTLNRNDVHRVEVLCPPGDTVALFDNRVWPLYRQVAALEKSAEALAKARDLLLPRLVNGDVTVGAGEISLIAAQRLVKVG
ncbi:restriction endonuclease subunit S [Candidatus Eisenbacteria bacterium]|uniref:Restriction endonuclease subunit S n=1 Tax=Eiseniibacteriota bacterium TaxID=2212470 RepID=A0ABV6YIM4_UNCEI